jgi:pSer/pThr/pTyr-binding forkhead associated (FHA) protein
LFLSNGQWAVQDLESCNGVFFRLREPVELQDGDRLLLGKQLLAFELMSEREHELEPALEHGVLLFGSPLRTPWARLRQLTVAGIARDVFHLHGPKVLVGREDGDLLFTGDEFMSRRHVELTWDGSQARAEDLGSSNGTFIRLRQPAALMSGDMVRVGDQLLRFETA